MRIRPLIAWFGLCLAFGPSAVAVEAAAPSAGGSTIESIEFLEDPTTKKTLEEVVNSTAWQTAPSANISLGSSKSTFWLRVRIVNHEPADRPLFLRLNNALIHRVHWYVPKDDGTFTQHRQGFLESPSNTNAFGDPKFVLPASDKKNQSTAHYLNVGATVPLNFVLALANDEELYKETSLTLIAFGVIFGIMLLMPLYNFLIYLFTRDVNFLLFSFFSFTLGLSIFIVEGLFSYVWPDFNLTLKERLLHFDATICYILLVQLTRRLLNVSVNAPRLDKVLVAVMIGMAFIPIAVLSGDTPFIITCAQAATAVSSVACLIAGIVCFRKSPVAPFFILGFSMFFGGSIVFVLQLSNVIESNILTVHAVHFGAVLEEAFLSFAIALKINVLNDQLTARSKDLEEANATLSAEIENGKRISKELEVQRSIAIHSAKLRAVGELAAGIAHQINNPLAILRLKLENLRFMLERAPIIEPEHTEIVQQVEGSEDVIIRMAKIITSLLRMSRISTDDPPVKVQLSHVTGEALEMCEQRFAANGVKVRVAPDLANWVIRCNAIDIAQTILNLLVNAYDAICEMPNPWIAVDARERDGMVELMITDSGAGIPAELREKIMEPFFTTKPTGVGTGVGLSIAADLVRRNNGRLYLESNCPNTRFVLSFPKTFPSNSSESARA